MQHHIFVSYSHADTDIMQRVRDALKAAGLRVWTDEGIHVGTPSWKETVERAIENSELLVVLMSPTANDSAWVQREIDYAEVKGVRMLPLLVKGTPQEAVPFALAGSQYVDIREEFASGMARLIERIERHLDRHDALTHLSTPHSRAQHAAHAADTVLSKPTQDTHEAETILSKPSQTRQRRQRALQWISAVAVLVAVLGSAIFFGFVNTAPDDAQAADNTDIRLRYNGQSLVLLNRADQAIDGRGLSFRLQTADDTLHTFGADEWQYNRLYHISSGDCLQVWDLMQVQMLSADMPPAETCDTRLRYRATFTTFWVSEHPDAVLQVHHNGQVLRRCPAAAPDDDAIIYECDIDLPINTAQYGS